MSDRQSSVDFRPVFTRHSAAWFRHGTIGLWTLFVSSVLAIAGSVTIGNPSFETPNINGFATYGQTPFLPWQVTETAPGQQVGLFDNMATPGPLITNVPVNDQVAFMIVGDGITLFQNLTDPGAVFTVGQSYSFTIAAGANNGTNDDAKLQLRLYYVDGSNVKQTVALMSYNFDLSENPNGITFLYDRSVTSAVVQASDPWKNQPIGIEIATPGTSSGNGGYWDVDNARLVSVPEPSSMLLPGLGLLGMVRRRRSVPTR